MESLKKVPDSKRFSVLYDLNECYFCGRPNPEKHEIFFGRNRERSKSYGYVVGLCNEHHTGNQSPHMNADIDRFFKWWAQKHYEENHGTREDFIKEFGKSYI